MSITKFQTVFDPTTNELDNIGSYIKAADGTLITHTGAALDVNIKTSDIAIDVDLDHASDSVKIGDGTDFLAVNADGSINVNFTATDLDIRDLDFAQDSVDVSGSEVSLDSATLAALENITVSATDLDIRDLAFATDKVDVSGSEVSLDSATLAALENITVSATDLDIRDLTHASDSVKVGDGSDFLAINSDGSINNVDRPFTSIAHGATLATTTAAVLVASPLAGRRTILIQNLGNSDVYLGAASVSDTNGIRLPKGASVELEKYGSSVPLYVRTASGNADVRYMEAV
jgi:hypothetical protein